MPPACFPPEERANQLRILLRPAVILRQLEAATDPGRPFVTVIGIKGSWNEREECEAVHFPEFERQLMSDPEVEAILRPLREMGFEFDWRGYSDPSGVEHCLAILRNPEAEAHLRRVVDGKDEPPAH